MSLKKYIKLVRGFAIYDIIMLFPLAVPFLVNQQLTIFNSIHTYLNLPGAQFTHLDETQMIFANLLGFLGIMWSIWRIRYPTVEVGIFEGWARAGFAVIFLYSVLQGASAIILLLFFIDVVGALLHLRGYKLNIPLNKASMA